MNKKVIATILALGMVAGAFAMMATPVKAADPMTWHFVDTISFADFRIRDTTSDGCNPNGGVARWIVVDTPAEVNTDVTTVGGSPYATMSNWIGAPGSTGTDYYVAVQTNAAQTNPTTGEPVVFFLEKDPNIAAAPQVYNPTSAASPLAGGTVPHGYIWAGADTHRFGDAEPLPSGSPPTTFFEVLEMPTPDLSAAPSITWAGVTHPADVCGNTNANIVTWHLWQSAANTGPWAEVGSAAFGTPINYAPVAFSWYSVSVTFTAGARSVVLSEPIQAGGGGADYPPEASALLSTPAIHNGNTINEFVTITATITESAEDTDPDTILGAEFRVDGGTAIAMTAVDGAFDGEASEAVTGVFDFPSPFTEGVHTFEVRGQDTGEGWNGTWVSGTFTVTDTTAPVAGWGTVPTDGYTNSTLTFNAYYEDFTDFQAALANSYFSWEVNGVPQADVAWTPTFAGWGSWTYTLSAQINTNYVGVAAGDQITYGGQVTGTEATPLTTVLGAGGPITLDDPPLISDPYPIYGYVYLYDGTSAGGYAPQIAPDGTPVTAYFYNTTGAFNTVVGAVADGLGEYTLDLDGLDATNAFGIEVVAGPFPGFGNMGYANITNADYTVGGSWIDVVCGVPYEVNITVPAPLPVFSATAGIPFPTTYEILDIDGVRAQGYFSFEGNMDWTSSDLVAPYPAVAASVPFEGTATGGVYTEDLTLFTGGLQTIRIADENGGVALPPWVAGGPGTNMYLTPWGAISYQIGGVATAGFLNDWDEVVVNVLAGGFDWNLVAFGWNLVSAPQDPIMVQTNLVYDAADALAEVNQYIFDNTGAFDPSLQMANRLPAGTYEMATLATLEADAFLIDSVHGYWIYAETSIVARIMAVNYTAAGANVLNAAAGWNVVGFTHNNTVWTGTPTASDFTDGTFGPVAPPQIVATMWDYTTQGYFSYVVDAGFPGMPSRDWVWDFSYSSQPGNGFFLYLDAAAVITFPVEY